MAKVATPYKLRAGKNISVAVLTGAMTASSGEFIALYFRGLPNSRSFGEPTYGVPTANVGHRFSDGSGINLTVGLGVDRLGRKYSSPLEPDVKAATDWNVHGTIQDPAIAAAVKWLRSR
jgi:C-terminal processing protease CtpA/Prc